MDKTTLGSSAILGIQCESGYISRNPESKLPHIGNPLISPLISESLLTFLSNVANRLRRFTDTTGCTLPSKGLVAVTHLRQPGWERSSILVILFSSSRKTWLCRGSPLVNGWGKFLTTLYSAEVIWQYSLVWTFSSGRSPCAVMPLARTSPASSLFDSFLACVKDRSQRGSWLSARCFTHGKNILLVLAIGVSSTVRHRPHLISTPPVVLMNGTGSQPCPLAPCKCSYKLQLRSSQVSSALALCIYIPEGLSRGSGKSYHMSCSYCNYLCSSRLMIITGILTLITAILFL